MKSRFVNRLLDALLPMSISAAARASWTKLIVGISSALSKLMVGSDAVVNSGRMVLLARIRDTEEKLMGYGCLDVLVHELVFD